MAAAALGLGVSRRVECCRCIILHSNYHNKNAAGTGKVFGASSDGAAEEPGWRQKQRETEEGARRRSAGQTDFFFFFAAGSNPALADTSVIKSDISDTLGCAREVTSSKAFIIRCMTDLNIYKIGFNN